jgi:methylated-DNA-[protein]-cysteine S-methyltransferase
MVIVMGAQQFLETLFEHGSIDFEPDAAMLAEARRRLESAVDKVRRPQAGASLVASPVGRLLVGITDRGIVMLHYLRNATDLATGVEKLRRSFDPIPDQAAAGRVNEELLRYLAGDETALRSQIDLRLVNGSFQRGVLERLCGVGPGAILTYSSLGAWAGAPNAPRAVGGAMHDNPVPIYVPCHRVIRSDGSLGGYGGGLDIKRKLLRAEGFTITAEGLVAATGAVWGHRGTRIFCRAGCRALARADRLQQLLFRDAKCASDAGMRACRVCHPQ